MMQKTKTEIRNLLEGKWEMNWPDYLEFDDGWNNHVYDGLSKLITIDPNIKFQQIKEKFGLLRVYYVLGSKDAERKVQSLCNDLERASAHICEKTGDFGQLMRKNGVYKTLNSRFIEDGWIPLSDPPFTTFITQH